MPDLRNIPRDLISKNPRNRRIARNDKTYASLLASMRAKGFDQAHPLRVRPTAGPGSTSKTFELVGGETRYDAGCELGLNEFPCVVEELSELEALIELAADNEQTPFTTIEKAMLLREIEAAGGVITMVLPRLGLSDSEASRAKRALSVFDHSVAEGCAGATLSDKETFLYEISRLPKARWTELSKRVEKSDISRSALREMVDRSKHTAGKKAPAREPVHAVGSDNADKVVKAVIAPAPDAHQNRSASGEVAEQSDTGSVQPADIDSPTVDRAHSSHAVTVLTTSSTTVGDVPILLASPGTAPKPAGAWVTLDALAEIYELPCAPPGWGCAMREGKPVFGPLRTLQAPARGAPQSEAPPPTLPIAPVIALQDALLAGLTRVALTDQLFAAIERVAVNGRQT